MSDRKIITEHVYPPIPIREFDWCAYRDGDEEEGPYGWGKTEGAAIDELHEREDEAEAERTPEYQLDDDTDTFVPPTTTWLGG